MKIHALLAPALAVILLSGCQATALTRTYDTPELVSSNSTIEEDQFRGGKKLIGPQQYFDTMSNSGTYFLLRHIITGDLETTQLYVQILNHDWAFYESAYWDNGEPANFLKIDSSAEAGTYSAYVLETFALEVPENLMKDRIQSGKDLKVKAYGKKGDKEITIQNAYLKGFMKYIEDNR